MRLSGLFSVLTGAMFGFGTKLSPNGKKRKGEVKIRRTGLMDGREGPD